MALPAFAIPMLTWLAKLIPWALLGGSQVWGHYQAGEVAERGVAGQERLAKEQMAMAAGQRARQRQALTTARAQEKAERAQLMRKTERAGARQRREAEQMARNQMMLQQALAGLAGLSHLIGEGLPGEGATPAGPDVASLGGLPPEVLQGVTDRAAGPAPTVPSMFRRLGLS